MKRSVTLLAALLWSNISPAALGGELSVEVGEASIPVAVEHEADPHWGGSNCTPAAALRALVAVLPTVSPGNDYLGNARGAGAPGFTVAVSHPRCGTFVQSTGLRNVEQQQPLLNQNRHHIGSLTKAVTASLVLAVNERGLFGPLELDTPIDQFLTRREIARLTIGDDPKHPRCPALVSARSRVTGQWETVHAQCPDLHQITLRHLLHSNHGMWDFINEVDRNHNQLPDTDEIVFASLLRRMGLDPAPGPRQQTAFGILAAVGLLTNPEATIGGNQSKDLELSGGNTGFQLLGIIVEKVTRRSYNELVAHFITEPLRLRTMYVSRTLPWRDRNVAREYAIATGADRVFGIGEDLLGVYPLVAINDNPAINTYKLDNYLVGSGGGGGGAGGLLSDVYSYLRFFKALVRGRLLSPAAQMEWRAGFMAVADKEYRQGYGVIAAPIDGLGTVLMWEGGTAGSNCWAGHSLAAAGGNNTTAVVCRNGADMFMGVGDLPPTALPAPVIGATLMLMARQNSP